MTTFLSLLLVSAFTADYFAIKLDVVPRAFTLVPEVFAMVAALVVVARAVTLRRWDQPPRIAWIMVALVLVCMIGVVAETVDPGPLVLGIREYFKFIPLILLPAVYRFSDRQLRILMGVFMFLATIQVPLAFFQRFVQFSNRMHTGDPITGTVTTSSALTIILCLAIALVMTLYVHRKIKLSLALMLFCYFAAPTTINETKATLILLPVATLGPFFLVKDVHRKMRMALPVIGICVFGLAGFATVYDSLIENRWGGRSIGDFISTGHYETYLYRGTDSSRTPTQIGRLDSMILPVEILSDEWMQLMFGLGIGNVSSSSFSGMAGAYADTYGRFGFGRTSIGNLIWEVGLLGLTVYIALFVFMWRDARRYASSDDDYRWIGTWWSVCIAILFLGLAYKSILNFNEIGYMLFFWSGLVASRNVLVKSPVSATKKSPKPTRLKLAGIEA